MPAVADKKILTGVKSTYYSGVGRAARLGGRMFIVHYSKSPRGISSLIKGLRVPMTLSNIQDSISDLSDHDYRKLKKWMLEEEDFDREIDKAATTGKLDVLVGEAKAAEAEGLLREL